MKRHKTEIELLKQGIAPLIEEYKQKLKKKELLKFQSMTKTIDKDHEKHYNYLMTLLNLNSIDQLTTKLHLLYRGSEHNFDCSKFHQLCDGKGKTLVLVRSTTKNLFGGYATIAWHSNMGSLAHGSFLFSLDKQTKHTILYKNQGNAIYGYPSLGPTFGGGNNGFDLSLSNNCHLNKNSNTDLGHTYSLPNNIYYNTNESKSYLTDSFYNFKVEEYEVYKILD